MINGYEENSQLVLDANVWTDCHFPFFPNSKGKKFFTDPTEIRAPMLRYRFDPWGSTNEILHPERVVFDGVSEFGRIDDHLVGKKYSRFWMLHVDISKPVYTHGFDVAVQPGFNTLICYNFETNTVQRYMHSNDTTFQEPLFMPRYDGSAPEDGYILILANLYRERRNRLLLFEAQNIQASPITKIILSLKLMDGLHSSWVDSKDIDLATLLQSNAAQTSKF